MLPDPFSDSTFNPKLVQLSFVSASLLHRQQHPLCETLELTPFLLVRVPPSLPSSLPQRPGYPHPIRLFQNRGQHLLRETLVLSRIWCEVILSKNFGAALPFCRGQSLDSTNLFVV